MKPSAQYPLKRLDEWYLEKFEKNYTDEVSYKVMKALTKEIMALSGKLSPLMFHIYRETSFRAVQNNVMVKGSAHMFSKNFAQLQQTIAEHAEAIHAGDTGAIEAAEMFQELAPIHNRMARLVDSVRSAVDTIFPSELKFEEIDELFLAEYGSPLKFMRSMTASLSILRRQSEGAIQELEGSFEQLQRSRGLDPRTIENTREYLGRLLVAFHIGEIINRSLEKVSNRIFKAT